MIVWKAKLDNGETRAGNALNSSWKDLTSFVHSGESKVLSLKLVHRDGREVKTKDNASAYFFGKKAVGQVGSPHTQHYIGIGHMQEDGMVEVTWYLPNFEEVGKEVKTPEKCGFFLARNRKENKDEKSVGS